MVFLNEVTNALIEDVTFDSLRLKQYSAVLIQDSTNVTLQRVTLVGSLAVNVGGIAAISSNYILVTHSNFDSNIAIFGGMLRFRPKYCKSKARFTGSLLPPSFCAASLVFVDSVAVVDHCVFSKNLVSDPDNFLSGGSGITSVTSVIAITNCDFIENYGPHGSSIEILGEPGSVRPMSSLWSSPNPSISSKFVSLVNSTFKNHTDAHSVVFIDGGEVFVVGIEMENNYYNVSGIYFYNCTGSLKNFTSYQPSQLLAQSVIVIDSAALNIGNLEADSALNLVWAQIEPLPCSGAVSNTQLYRAIVVYRSQAFVTEQNWRDAPFPAVLLLQDSDLIVPFYLIVDRVIISPLGTQRIILAGNNLTVIGESLFWGYDIKLPYAQIRRTYFPFNAQTTLQWSGNQYWEQLHPKPWRHDVLLLTPPHSFQSTSVM